MFDASIPKIEIVCDFANRLFATGIYLFRHRAVPLWTIAPEQRALAFDSAPREGRFDEIIWAKYQ
jgi:hypothetical protein